MATQITDARRELLRPKLTADDRSRAIGPGSKIPLGPLEYDGATTTTAASNTRRRRRFSHNLRGRASCVPNPSLSHHIQVPLS